jgi:hypothetical protein
MRTWRDASKERNKRSAPQFDVVQDVCCHTNASIRTTTFQFVSPSFLANNAALIISTRPSTHQLKLHSLLFFLPPASSLHQQPRPARSPPAGTHAQQHTHITQTHTLTHTHYSACVALPSRSPAATSEECGQLHEREQLKQNKRKRAVALAYERSPRMRRASSMSLGTIVTRFAWMAHRFVSSNSPTRYDSAASCE